MVEGMAALQWWDVLVRLAAAAAFGAALGFEREVDGHEAGVRTHALLALGAAVFGVTSVGAFDRFTTGSATNVQVDVTRIASYVAAGVGFIGGGVILKHVGMVKGITTATSLWCAAAVGLAAGLGFWGAAAGATAIGLFTLAGMRPLNRVAARLARSRADALVIQLHPGASLAGVLPLLEEVGRRNIKQLTIGAGEVEGTTEIRAEFWDSPDPRSIGDLLSRLTKDGSVRSAYHASKG